MNKELSDLFKKRTWKNKLRYFLYSPIRIFSDVRLKIKWGFQRMFRGFDDRAYWGLSYYLEEIIIPVIKWQIKYGSGYPAQLTSKKWDEIRKRIVKGFEADKKMDMNYKYKFDGKVYQNWEKQYQEGMKLFAKYFRGLWD